LVRRRGELEGEPAGLGRRGEEKDGGVAVNVQRIQALEDRFAIANLVNSYAQGVDRRDARGVAALFTFDGILCVGPTSDGVQASHIEGRDRIVKALVAGLSRYRSTFHEITSHTVTFLDDGENGDVIEEATAQTGCVAHHISGPEQEQRDHVWYINYFDELVRDDDGWRFAKRQLRVDIVADRPLEIE
jgi:uncharacterized protein (TIGR02246 family)